MNVYILQSSFCYKKLPHISNGPGWIRTNVAYATDLQSAPFNHSGTDPFIYLLYHIKNQKTTLELQSLEKIFYNSNVDVLLIFQYIYNII